LQVDTRDGLLKGGDSGPAIIPGDPAQSRLIQAITWQHDLKMPPSGKLAADQIDDLTTWVKMGAPDPRTGSTLVSKSGPNWTEARKFWAFRPVKIPEIPQVKATSWVKSPIDAFVLSKLEGAGLIPAPPADKRLLIRRVTYDLTGLPP